MERGSSKHGARVDEELGREVQGRTGGAGGHREEWAETEPRAAAEDRIDRTELPRDISTTPADDDDPADEPA